MNRKNNIQLTFIILFTFFLVRPQSVFPQEKAGTDIYGTYYFRSKVIGSTFLKLKIKRDSSFIYKSDSHLSGVFTDYGRWVIENDTLILETLIRKENNKNIELKSTVFRYYLYKPGRELCWKLKDEEKGIERCFMKKKHIFRKPPYEKVH